METILNNNQPIDEMCPFCEREVKLKPVFSVQICPYCGELILPCNLCDHNTCDCANCPLEEIRLDIEITALSKYL
jgi:predicted RNA-binding Zn-ribbon protein involved in translation (DUF1610 family)